MSEITVEVTQSDITANVTSPNITANVTSADIAANVTTTEVTANVEAANVTVNISGGGSPHIIQDEGVAETQRANLNFVGAAVTVTDDSVNNATIVTISGGGGGGAWGDITGTLSDQTDLQTALDGKVDENTGITGATKTKITYDAKGLVTAGADAAIADITGLQTALDAKAAASHTHPLSDITQSGASTDQVPIWNGSAWLPGDQSGGGAVEIIDVTYSEMETLIGDSELVPGQFYRITDAAGTDLGFVTQAVRENELATSGTGGFLNADFEGIGVYDGVETETGVAVENLNGIWRPENESDYQNGDIVIYNSTHFQVIDYSVLNEIVPNMGGQSFISYENSTMRFVFDEFIEDGSGAEATVLFDDVLRSRLYITNISGDWSASSSLTGSFGGEADVVSYTENPDNPYSQLPKSQEMGFIKSFDIAEFVFSYNWLRLRVDVFGNYVSLAFEVAESIFNEPIPSISEFFEFGNPSLKNNQCFGGVLISRNSVHSCSNNVLFPFSKIEIYGADFNAEVNDNILENGAQITGLVLGDGGVFSRNKIGPGATMGPNIEFGPDCTIENNILENGAQLTGITAGANCSISRNKIGPGATLGGDTTMEDDSQIDDNILENGASLTGITAGANCSISRNKIGPGATLGGDTTMEDDSQIINNVLGGDSAMTGLSFGESGLIQSNVIGANASIHTITADVEAEINYVTIAANGTLSELTIGAESKIEYLVLGLGISVFNKVIEDGVEFNTKLIESNITEVETISDNVDGSAARPGFSDIPGGVEIDGVTTLDITAAWAQYRGIINVTSPNSTEEIDQIDNPPELFPFTIRPAAGLTLTITGTAYSGIAAGQIALKATDYVLDGDKGEYIVLEIDPLGTECLVEKSVVNGLI